MPASRGIALVIIGTRTPAPVGGRLDRYSARVLSLPGARRAVQQYARQRTLVLLYHRVGPVEPGRDEVVSTVPVEVFRRHLEALGDIGPIVPLAAAGQHRGPSFALTFDDDGYEHSAHVLPVLSELGVPATFFLSGRWLHEIGPYWWEVLEDRVASDGLAGVVAEVAASAAASRELEPSSLRDVRSASDLARLVVGTDATQVFRASTTDRKAMSDDDLRQLVDAGMEIGFHTRDHPVMTRLDSSALLEAATAGCDQLASAAAVPVTRFSYPHGRAGHREAAAVASAGFQSAFTTAQRPTGRRTDPMLAGRWEPGARSVDDFLVGVLQRLVRRPSGSPRDV